MGLKLNTAMAVLATLMSSHISAAEVQITDGVKLDWGVDAYIRAYGIDPDAGKS